MMFATQTATEKRALRRRHMLPLKRTRPALQRLRADLTRKLARFLHAQAPKIAAQIAALRAKHGKAEMSEDERAAVEAIIAQIDFSGWSVLVGDVEGDIEAVIKDSAYAALAQVGIDVEARPEIRNIVDERAVAYARERGAEMVGMRVDDLGRLVENPNAFWRITEPTRDYVRADVTTAIAEGWSNDRLSSALAEAYGFSKERATVIARTETNRAASVGALAGYKASGVVEAKQWLTAEDDLVSEECQENGQAGPGGDGVLPLDADYPSGDEAPPVHPNCRCAIAPVVDLASNVLEEGEGAGQDGGGETSILETAIDVAQTVEVLTEAGGTVAEAGAAATEMAEASEAAAVEAAAPTIAFRGGEVSDGFRSTVTSFFDSLPPSIAETLAENDISIAVGDRMTSIAPELKGQHPRGYPAGATWDWSTGAFMPEKREIIVSETYRMAGTKVFVSPTSFEIRGTLAHETGHGVDRALGRASKQFYYESRRPEFIAAYKLDAKGVRAAGKADPLGIIQGRYRYYMQKGDAGPSEAFAESFAQIINGPRFGKDMAKMFPRVTAYIQKLIDDMEAEAAA